MGIVDRGSRGERHPRSQWPEKPSWRPRSRAPEPPPSYRSPTAWATLIFAGLCIAVFAYGYALSAQNALIRDYAYFPADLASDGAKGYLRLITHMFLHGDWVHLLVNMICLYSFGRGIEPVLGTPRFVVLYLVTGALAALGHGFFTETPTIPLVGASGAIAGIIGAAAVAAPRMPVIFFIFPMPLFIAVLALVALHIAAIAFDWEPDIAWYAHLVGLAAGALLYPLLRRRQAR